MQESWINVCSNFSTTSWETLLLNLLTPKMDLAGSCCRGRGTGGCRARPAWLFFAPTWAVPIQTHLRQATHPEATALGQLHVKKQLYREKLHHFVGSCFGCVFPDLGKNFLHFYCQIDYIAWQQHCFFWSISEGNTEVWK